MMLLLFTEHRPPARTTASGEGSFSAVSKPILRIILSTRLAAIVNLYNICALVHRSKFNILVRTMFQKQRICDVGKNSDQENYKICKHQPNFAIMFCTVDDIILFNIVGQKMKRAYLPTKSVPIRSKTSHMLPTS